MPKNIRELIRKGDTPAIGTWLSLGNEAIAEIFCNAGFSWICIDIEHSPCSLETTERLIRTIDLAGKAPLVRLSSNDPVQIKRVLDSGAHGLIVPMVNSKEDVLRAYQSMHFPPLGNRGVGLARAQGYGPRFKDYHSWHKDNAPLIIQIEHIDALENLDDIFSCKEVDAYMVGPYDLSASMGIPGQFDHPDLLVALEKIKDTAKKYNVSPGIHIVEPNKAELKDRISEGYTFIAYSVDFRILDHSAREALNSIETNEK
ncbi:MAG: 2-dehydro-3-deoxyglucarate aldolase [Bacteriovoracaceae bacterium]|jgi:2-dehydro-3-deoxyglucarate aldolase